MCGSVVFTILAVLAYSFTGCSSQSGTACPSVKDRPNCVCSRNNIDLSPLASSGSNPTPRLKTVATDVKNHTTTFSYNPCYPFTIPNCEESYLCAKSDITISLALKTSEKMYTETDGTSYLYYEGAEASDTVKVYLHCVNDSGLEKMILNEKNLNFSDTRVDYTFNLTSCHACPGGCSVHVSASIAGPVGFILMALLFLAVTMYCVIGAAYLKVKHRADGPELIPHRNFWEEIPALVKDGFLFTISPIRKLSGSPHYQPIG